MNFEEIWRNIQLYEGEVFKTFRGIEYKYVIYDDYLLINNDKRRRIKKDYIKTAIEIKNPTPSKLGDAGIRGQSYVFGIITDNRIRRIESN